MAHESEFLTEEGLAKLTAELEHLRKVKRREVAERIHNSKELEATVDNAEYDDAKNEQAFVEGRILTLETLSRNATIVHPDHPTNRVVVGATVKVSTKDGKEQYTIVGSTEADPAHGRISNESPVGRALLGRRVGDEVTVHTPRGVMKFKILEVK